MNAHPGAARFSVVSALAAGLLLAGCGGDGGGDGNGSATPVPPPTGSPPPPATASSTGLWKGTLTSPEGTTSELVGFVDPAGDSVWMTPAGRVFDGVIASAPAGDQLQLRLHDYDIDRMGTHEMVQMRIETHTTSLLEGRFQVGTASEDFRAERHEAWERAGSLDTLAGVYTRSLGSGYTMTMSVTRNGELTGSDTLGCQWTGTVTIPDPQHNLYHVAAGVSACGDRDGHYEGFGALFDADAMLDWMNAMRPFEHGHTGGHGPGGHGPGPTTIPSGQQNLFMFGLHDESRHRVIVDALAR